MSFNKSINDVCSRKLQEVCGGKGRLLSETFFAGGVITSHCKGEQVKDYDLFFTTVATLEQAVYYYLSPHNQARFFKLAATPDKINPKLTRVSIQPREGAKLTTDQFIKDFNLTCKKTRSTGQTVPAYLSHNALSLNNGVQLIFRFVGEPEDVFSTFDYEHCKTFWRPSPLGISEGKTYFLGRSLESLAKNELIYTSQSRFVLSAISRLNKFIKRGWGVAPSSLLAIASSAAKVDWGNKEKLREELLGIYGIDPEVLTQILDYSSKEEKLDLDKVIEMLGEV